jgi:hypothetical protein
MQDIIYLFLESISCYDTFNHLFEEMVNRKFNCIKLIGDKTENIKEIIDSLVGKKIVVITTTHLNNKLKDEYSIENIIKLLNPIKKYWALHDVGCKYIKDPISNWSMLLPGKEWEILTKPYSNVDCDVVGYQKFYNISFEKKYNKIFFPSLIYIYNNRPIYNWINNYKFIIENNYPIKFPDYPGSFEFIEKLQKEKVSLNLLDTKLNSFNLMAACNTVITNTNSSVGIEAAILGCNSINIGKKYIPTKIYDKFKVKIISEASEVDKIIFEDKLSPLNEYMFNIDKAIKIITNN